MTENSAPREQWLTMPKNADYIVSAVEVLPDPNDPTSAVMLAAVRSPEWGGMMPVLPLPCPRYDCMEIATHARVELGVVAEVACERHGPAQDLCLDCGRDTIALGEYYAVEDDVWVEAIPADDDDRMCCIGCLEQRLGRTLTPSDFKGAELNTWQVGMSARLRDRLGLVDVEEVDQ